MQNVTDGQAPSPGQSRRTSQSGQVSRLPLSLPLSPSWGQSASIGVTRRESRSFISNDLCTWRGVLEGAHGIQSPAVLAAVRVRVPPPAPTYRDSISVDLGGLGGLVLMEVVEELGAFGLMPYHGHGCGAGDAGTFQVTYGGAAEIVELETTFQNQRAR